MRMPLSLFFWSHVIVLLLIIIFKNELLGVFKVTIKCQSKKPRYEQIWKIAWLWLYQFYENKCGNSMLNYQKFFTIIELLCGHTLGENRVQVDDYLCIDYFEIILGWYAICRLQVKVRIICSLVLCFEVHLHVLILGIKSIPADLVVRTNF